MLDVILTIAGVIALVLIWIMLYDSNRFVVVQHCFCDKRIKEDFRAVVLADLHNKQYGKENERLTGAIDELKPDAVLIAGDMITAVKGKNQDGVVEFIGHLAQKYPVYYSNGNHEHRLKLYPQEYGDAASEYEQGLSGIGVSRMVNRKEILQEKGIAIYGSEIDKRFYRRFHVDDMEAGYLEQLLGKPDEEYYNILLAHNPDYFPQYADWGADLVFSGHVHGGLVRVPFWKKGVVSPAVRLFPEYDGGKFENGKSTMILSRGLGVHTIPVRLFNPGELIVIDLKKDDTLKEQG